MGLYARYVLPKLIDAACAQPPMTELRSRYVPQAEGDVLEIGIGSGLNLPHYTERARSVTGLDPHAELTVLARRRAAQATPEVDVLQISGEEIPAEDARFDTIVCTWTLCSIPNVYRALKEMHRVVKPGGRFYFVEHGLSPDEGVQAWQRRIEPLWKIIGGGCHLTRKADALIQDAGFVLPEVESGYQPGPRWAAYMTHGVAVKPR
ncbi:MAG: class I SAM-dependent methyltransferase [Pseudomonadales bacterium]|jgi:SAM-dependent methyltransferase